MSSPSFGAMSPFMDRVQKLKDMAMHPLNTLSGMVQTPDPHQAAHDQAIQQVNQNMNAHKNDAANASFIHPAKIEDQKRPLKAK